MIRTAPAFLSPCLIRPSMHRSRPSKTSWAMIVDYLGGRGGSRFRSPLMSWTSSSSLQGLCWPMRERALSAFHAPSVSFMSFCPSHMVSGGFVISHARSIPRPCGCAPSLGGSSATPNMMTAETIRSASQVQVQVHFPLQVRKLSLRARQAPEN